MLESSLRRFSSDLLRLAGRHRLAGPLKDRWKASASFSTSLFCRRAEGVLPSRDLAGRIAGRARGLGSPRVRFRLLLFRKLPDGLTHGEVEVFFFEFEGDIPAPKPVQARAEAESGAFVVQRRQERRQEETCPSHRPVWWANEPGLKLRRVWSPAYLLLTQQSRLVPAQESIQPRSGQALRNEATTSCASFARWPGPGRQTCVEVAVEPAPPLSPSLLRSNPAAASWHARCVSGRAMNRLQFGRA